MAGDTALLSAAIALSARGRGRTAPNPNVGCILLDAAGHVAGRGWTQPGGRPHAEAMALAQAGDRARGGTAYVSLEPCAHDSARGPCCASLLAGSGVARVVVALTDPDPRTNGEGVARLRAAGIAVTVGMLETEARAAMAGFLTRQRSRRPFVTLKLATSLDGCIALPDGSSQWITGEAARAHAHVERAQHELILIGRGTLAHDRPRLDIRLPGLADRSPVRCVLSRSGAAPDGWLAVERPSDIASLPGDHLLIEGGAQTAAAFLTEDLVDRLLLYRAPILIGRGMASLADIGLIDLADAHDRWRLTDERALAPDRLEVYERMRAG
ncbi:diaminohydroxyphosphoribosylaminopyrimidine deaminase/5-amino-6-(5-phosphoribosylamino)uracil reductase [Sphingobium sp. SYK-6]|uniref:bifunctional diaminohydroxyphosphoribosylaminopyrimidine deaminase/5-amino-6-(5-phosphoribosylamino)uracil reductase RibD n=1 Tax=Sphingobium sp. (strain NBRC 103272 / SYK-6) TaxID=627192 RepID=UPI0002277DBB|nr:bifunctional diaminohydroxyphosphoribosylaminopyrimidine deaminase/5-amino-6-(5-phosphoribosylamino)uracil reductase RibD [Sphingobium sp. SYK-6]BAK68367.1 diaminohydroxyphosphoribosylaminopyrimidine deaminase/5-amino-6-(5-phosphoribosylamino)uracil reductase [Sphingobium sp. SYK-6]